MDPRELERRREVNDAMRHETRTWLGIGKGYLSMLTSHFDQLTPDQRKLAIEGLASSYAKLDAFTRNVLLDEQLQTRDVEAQRGDVTVEQLVAPVRAAYPDVAVEAEGGTARVDPVMAREIVDNLVRNAVTVGTPPVTLRVRAEAGCLRIEVHDAGSSVTEDDVLFERYAVTAASAASKKSGIGLGLSIVRRYAEAHGGSAGVRLGDGTTFWVTLPY